MMICIAGKHEIAVRGLQLAVDLLGKESVCVCLNRNESIKPFWQPSLLRFATEIGVPVMELKAVQSIKDIIFLSLEFDRIVAPERFASTHLFNIHFSLLPAYKGVYTAAWPLLNGESCSGVTLHRIDNGIDTGPIIRQRKFEIISTWNARDLYLNCMSQGIRLLEEAFEAVVFDKPAGVPQRSGGSSYFGRDSINYSSVSICLNRTASQIDKQVRAMHFREFQIPQVCGMPVGRVEILSQRSVAKPGTVLSVTELGIEIATIDFDIFCYRDRSMDYIHLARSSDVEGILNYQFGSAHIDYTDINGWSPLMIASFNGSAQLCKALLERGANPNLANANGTTPLMFAKDSALKSGDVSAIIALKKHGANPMTKDRFGRTVFDYLNKGSNSSISKQIIEAVLLQ